MCHGKSEGQATPAQGPRRKRGRPPKPDGPTSPSDRKAAQRARERVAKETHPDRVVTEASLLWFEVWVSVDSTTPDGRKVHTEGYRRFGEYPSNTAYGLLAKLPEEYRGRAEKVLESMGLLPKRTAEMRSRKPEHDYDREGKTALNAVGSKATDYADLSITERIGEINERAGAKNTRGEGAGQSTYEPPRTEAATVNDAAHVLRLHGTEIAVGPLATEERVERMAAWWQQYQRPYGGGATISAKIVRLSTLDAIAAVERLAEHVHEACSMCGTTPLVSDEATLTLGCPQCGEFRYVSLPRGILRVGGKRVLTPEEEMEGAWRTRENE